MSQMPRQSMLLVSRDRAALPWSPEGWRLAEATPSLATTADSRGVINDYMPLGRRWAGVTRKRSKLR